MKLTGNTIFITGATSGIGLGLAVALSELGNKVIVSGRNEVALREVKAKYPEFVTYRCDVSKESDLVAAADWLQKNHKVSVLINNAGVYRDIDFTKGTNLADMEEEMRVNYFAPLKLISLLLPSLQKEKAAAIVIVSSGLAYLPFSTSPLYGATKAALHSLSISLRNQLKKTPVKVIEILPPLVDTKMVKGMGESKMSVETFVRKTIKALGRGKEEIRIGQTSLLYYMARLSPSLMNYFLNKGSQS